MAALFLGLPVPGAGQAGTIQGTVVSAGDRFPVNQARVGIQGLGITTITDEEGRYLLRQVPAGQHVVVIRWLGFRPEEIPVTVVAGVTNTVDATLETDPIALDAVVVSVSRWAQRIVDAPAAVSVAEPLQVRAAAVAGGIPLAVAGLPGVDVVQSGMSDFNLNARGFNSSLNRRVLVLQDGRDLGVALLGAQEWSATSFLDEAASIEMVRGPGSALYGANAYNGVLSITTPSALQTVGTKISLGGGELGTLTVDGRHAGILADGQLAYRISGGYSTSDTWTRSRTSFDGLDLSREYASATDEFIPAGTPEAQPLIGQELDNAVGSTRPGQGIGERDPIESYNGVGRLEWYRGSSVTTVEGGTSLTSNATVLNGGGRMQIPEVVRPWARVSWQHSSANLMAWYSGRTTKEPMRGLTADVPTEEESSIFHVEGQLHGSVADDRLRVVLGASARRYQIDTKGTLFAVSDDGRADRHFSAYGQAELEITPTLGLVVAARADDGDLFPGQFSPKAAIVFNPTGRDAFRLSISRAFQTPSYTERLVSAAFAPPTAGPFQLEQGIEQLFQSLNGGPFASAVADLGLPNDLPWDFDASTPAVVLGNAELDVETVVGWELGYKRDFDGRGYVTADLYRSDLSNFVTDLLPGAVHPGGNPLFTGYSLGDQGTDVSALLASLNARVQQLAAAGALPADQAAPLLGTLAALSAGYGGLEAGIAPLLATLDNGSRALVLSFANAGEVTEQGFELGAGFSATDELSLDASYSYFELSTEAALVDDHLSPNTPRHKGSLAASFRSADGWDARVSGRFTSSFDWASGIYEGRVPSGQTIDVSGGYQINDQWMVQLAATNVFDQQRYRVYGGSLIGRRAIVRATWSH